MSRQATVTRLVIVPAGAAREAMLARLGPEAPRVELVADDAPGRVDVIFARFPRVAAVREALDRHPEVRWVHSAFAGLPSALLALARERGLLLTNGRGAFGQVIAEYVLAVILAHYKRLPELRERQARAEWDSHFRVAELRGRTVGLLGLGDLGRSAARLLRPFGARLHGLRRSPEPAPEVDRLFGPGDLHAFLADLDVLVLAAPLTPETSGLIGAAELAALPRGAYLVNVGRGALLHEEALVAALRSGHLTGAALDVFTTEPLPAESPLWRLPTVTISPHCADHTESSEGRIWDIFLENLARFTRGEPLRNVVDLERGY